MFSWDSVSFCAILCRCRMFPPAPDCQREGPSPICPKTSLSGGWPFWKVCEWPKDPTVHFHGMPPLWQAWGWFWAVSRKCKEMQWEIDAPSPTVSLWKPSHCLALVLKLLVTAIGWSLGAVTSWCQNYSSGDPGCRIWESQILQNVESVKKWLCGN